MLLVGESVWSMSKSTINISAIAWRLPGIISLFVKDLSNNGLLLFADYCNSKSSNTVAVESPQSVPPPPSNSPVEMSNGGDSLTLDIS